MHPRIHEFIQSFICAEKKRNEIATECNVVTHFTELPCTLQTATLGCLSKKLCSKHWPSHQTPFQTPFHQHNVVPVTYLGNSYFAVKSLKLATGCPMVGINAFAQHIVSSFSSFFLYIIIFLLSFFVSVSFLTKSIRISRVCISNEKLFTWIFNYNSTDAEIGFYTNLDRHPIQIPL